jgi:hypothetical protein
MTYSQGVRQALKQLFGPGGKYDEQVKRAPAAQLLPQLWRFACNPGMWACADTTASCFVFHA